MPPNNKEVATTQTFSKIESIKSLNKNPKIKKNSQKMIP